jgi:hypothetical protein
MSQISLKSISGITSITTPAGVDNQLTVHTNDTTEVLKVTSSGLNVTGVITATSFSGVVQSDTPLGNSTSSTVFYEADNETTISSDTTLSRASSNPGVIYTKFQQVVVANTKSLIVDAGETLVVDAYKLRQPDF